MRLAWTPTQLVRGVLLPWARTITWLSGTPHPEFGTATGFTENGRNPEYPTDGRLLPYIDTDVLETPSSAP